MQEVIHCNNININIVFIHLFSDLALYGHRPITSGANTPAQIPQKREGKWNISLLYHLFVKNSSNAPVTKFLFYYFISKLKKVVPNVPAVIFLFFCNLSFKKRVPNAQLFLFSYNLYCNKVVPYTWSARFPWCIK